MLNPRQIPVEFIFKLEERLVFLRSFTISSYLALFMPIPVSTTLNFINLLEL